MTTTNTKLPNNLDSPKRRGKRVTAIALRLGDTGAGCIAAHGELHLLWFIIYSNTFQFVTILFQPFLWGSWVNSCRISPACGKTAEAHNKILFDVYPVTAFFLN